MGSFGITFPQLFNQFSMIKIGKYLGWMSINFIPSFWIFPPLSWVFASLSNCHRDLRFLLCSFTIFLCVFVRMARSKHEKACRISLSYPSPYYLYTEYLLSFFVVNFYLLKWVLIYGSYVIQIKVTLCFQRHTHCNFIC